MSRLAVTIWKNRISPVFESAENLLVVDLIPGRPWREMQIPVQRDSQLDKVCKLFELEVSVLFCGAISHIYSNMIQAYGIELIPFLSGDARKLLLTYTQGYQNLSNFQMPGCRGKKRRRFRGGKKYPL